MVHCHAPSSVFFQCLALCLTQNRSSVKLCWWEEELEEWKDKLSLLVPLCFLMLTTLPIPPASFRWPILAFTYLLAAFIFSRKPPLLYLPASLTHRVHSLIFLQSSHNVWVMHLPLSCPMFLLIASPSTLSRAEIVFIVLKKILMSVYYLDIGL